MNNYIYLIDEIQVSEGVRSPAWIKASYKSIQPGIYGTTPDVGDFIEYPDGVENAP